MERYTIVVNGRLIGVSVDVPRVSIIGDMVQPTTVSVDHVLIGTFRTPDTAFGVVLDMLDHVAIPTC